MARTKITHLQIAIEPRHVIESMNTKNREEWEASVTTTAGVPEPDVIEASRFIEHPDGAQVQCVGATMISGGNPVAGRFLLDFVVLEPVVGRDGSEDQAQ